MVEKRSNSLDIEAYKKYILASRKLKTVHTCFFIHQQSFLGYITLKKIVTNSVSLLSTTFIYFFLIKLKISHINNTKFLFSLISQKF